MKVRVGSWKREHAVIFVVDAAAARAALHARLLACPADDCDGRLRPWGHARPRAVADLAGYRERLVPDRGRCPACLVSHVLVPASCVPRHGHTAEVIGTALAGHAWIGYGHRRLAGLLDVAGATVRGWLRRADRAAGALYRHGLDLAAVLPWASCPPACPAPGQIAPPTALARALSELAGAARGFTRPCPPAQPVSDTGIDYLHQLHAAADRALCADLHLCDPAGQRHTLPAWPAINVLTRGRLPAAPT
jgi:hypothetical protein